MFAWHRLFWLQYPQRCRFTAVSLIPRLVYVTGGSTTLFQWMRFQCVNATDKFQRRWKILVFSVSFTLLEFVGLSKLKRQIHSQWLNLNEHWSTVRINTIQEIIKHYPGSLGSFGSSPFIHWRRDLGARCFYSLSWLNIGFYQTWLASLARNLLPSTSLRTFGAFAFFIAYNSQHCSCDKVYDFEGQTGSIAEAEGDHPNLPLSGLNWLCQNNPGITKRWISSMVGGHERFGHAVHWFTFLLSSQALERVFGI